MRPCDPVPAARCGHLHLARERARAPAHLAAIADAHGRRIARQLGQLEARREALLTLTVLVIGDRLQPAAPPSYCLTNLIRRLFFSIELFLAINLYLLVAASETIAFHCRNGKLNARNRARASSSDFAVVQTMMSMPTTLST